jgi:RimJ/RimL family protein N-acetyltransferase
MASNYNRLGRPAMVGVRGGRVRLLLRREDASDLDRLEAAAEALPAVSVPDGVTVRPARPEDAKGVLDMWRAVVAEGNRVRTEEVRATAAEYRKRFRRPWTPKEASVVAEVDGHIVGLLGISREDHPVNRHIATLGLSVMQTERGRGIGSALMAEAVRWAVEHDVEKLALSVYPGNRAALRLYAKFGFIEEGRLSGHSKKTYGYEDEIAMGRWLIERGSA